MREVTESTPIIAVVLGHVESEWMRFVQARLSRNRDHLDQLRECRSVQDCVALQTQAVREIVSAFLQSAHRMSERTTKFAGKARREMKNMSLHRAEHYSCCSSLRLAKSADKQDTVGAIVGLQRQIRRWRSAELASPE